MKATFGKLLKSVLAVVLVILGFVLIYRLLCVRVVNYEIAGIKIPSKYNIITGKVTPILNYNGRAIRKTVKSRRADKLGLTDEEVAMAQLKWALFEQWANSRKEYKGWDKNPEVFRKADEAFKTQIKFKKE